MKFQCTAYVWKDGYVMVDGNKTADMFVTMSQMVWMRQ
jgi:hypothetical protein